MPVSPDNKRVILVVHGVQLADDDSQHQDDMIRRSIESRLNHVDFEFEVDLYRYENLSDACLQRLKSLSILLMSTGVGAVVAPAVIDIVGDVAISLSKNSMALSNSP